MIFDIWAATIFAFCLAARPNLFGANMADIILSGTETTGDAVQIGESRGGWWQIEVKDYSVQVTIEIEYIDESGWVEIFNFTDNGAKTFLAVGGRKYRAKAGTAGATVFLSRVV